jgi:hypothetical protein
MTVSKSSYLPISEGKGFIERAKEQQQAKTRRLEQLKAEREAKLAEELKSCTFAPKTNDVWKSRRTPEDLMHWKEETAKKLKKKAEALHRVHTPEKLHPKKKRPAGKSVFLHDRFVDIEESKNYISKDTKAYATGMNSHGFTTNVEDRLYNYKLTYEKQRKDKEEMYFASVKLGTSASDLHKTVDKRIGLGYTADYSVNHNSKPISKDINFMTTSSKLHKTNTEFESNPKFRNLFSSKTPRVIRSPKSSTYSPHRASMKMGSSENPNVHGQITLDLDAFKKKQSVDKRRQFAATIKEAESVLGIDQPDFISLNAQKMTIESHCGPKNFSLAYTKELEKAILNGEFDAEDQD